MKYAVAILLVLGCASNNVQDRSDSRVPNVTDVRGLPNPQAVTDLDINGQSLAVTTLSFRDHPNFWALNESGDILFRRSVLPWAPFQAACTSQGAYGVGLAYSRVTGPLPTISLFNHESDPETVLEDSYGERGWLRYGEGDWKTGWLRSLIGDLIVRAGDSVITVRGHNGAMRMTADGKRDKFPINDRPYRMASSADGKAVAFGFIVPEATKRPLVSMIDSSTGAELWKVAASAAPNVPPLPDPGADYPELAETFKLKPDEIVPFRVAVSVAPSTDGMGVATADYGGRMWIRRGPAIGKWDPPYHQIPFLPRQRGTLRIAWMGTEKAAVPFPEDGLFEVRVDSTMKRVWAIPMSWFARGAAAATWLPTDPGSRKVFAFDLATSAWTVAWSFPDAVNDVAVGPDGSSVWTSCWDGKLYFGEKPMVDIRGTARIKWNKEGTIAYAGTDQGEVLALSRAGELLWKRTLPYYEPGPAGEPNPVFKEIPIYAVGRVGKEHAYVGDIWLVKTETGAFLVDAAGTSNIPQTLRKIKAAGVDPKSLQYLLHSHSHGDHSGAGYLWRSMGLKIVAPATASLALSWLMPMLTDYGVWVPRPVDVPLPLKRPGDETEFTVAGIKIRAVFVPGHSFDSTVYMMELNGKRVVFTGDIGFQAPSDILHRCWGDVDKAAVVTEIVKTKVIPFKPDVVFTGHGGRPEGTAFLEDLVKRSEESIQNARSK